MRGLTWRVIPPVSIARLHHSGLSASEIRATGYGTDYWMPETSPSPLTARRSGALRGSLRVPADKSISHRALIFGALTVAETRISGLLERAQGLGRAEACHPSAGRAALRPPG